MFDRILVRAYSDLPMDREEVLRYAAVRFADLQTQELLGRCLEEYPGGRGKVCYLEVPLIREKDCLNLAFARTDSRALAANLDGCGSVLLFAATVGLEIDRLIQKYSRVSAARALLFQALGTQQVEALCRRFCQDMEEELKRKGKYLRPRFSPGYGDLPLTLQTALLAVLDGQRKLGISLSDSLLMVPTKSVTALVGLSDRPCRPGRSGCSYCDKTDCEFREG